jgi:hypothetical protein
MATAAQGTTGVQALPTSAGVAMRRERSQWHWVVTFSIGLAIGLGVVALLVGLCMWAVS